MIMISFYFIFNFINFCFIASFFTKSMSFGILLSTAVRVVVVVVAKLVILVIWFFNSSNLALWIVLVANFVISGILSSILLVVAFIHLF